MKSCLLFQSKLWIFDKNSSLLNLLSHISQYNPAYSFIQSYEFLKRIQVLFVIAMWNWIFFHISHNENLFALSYKAKNSSLVFKSRDVWLNLFSHISHGNFVCSFIQSYQSLIRIQDLEAIYLHHWEIGSQFFGFLFYSVAVCRNIVIEKHTIFCTWHYAKVNSIDIKIKLGM